MIAYALSVIAGLLFGFSIGIYLAPRWKPKKNLIVQAITGGLGAATIWVLFKILGI